MRKCIAIALTLLVVALGCSQSAPVPKAAPPKTSPAPQLGARPAPQAERVSLKTGMVYQSGVAVALASEVKGSVSQTLPPNGYFEVVSAQPDGWYQVVVSDGSNNWTMWLDGTTLTMGNLRESPQPKVTAPPPTYYQQAPAPSTQTGGGTDQVYITNTGKKYHRAGCRYLSKSQIAISRSDAHARGYGACSVCRP
jgi:hypothetical protein